jgi:hypothetical protein
MQDVVRAYETAIGLHGRDADEIAARAQCRTQDRPGYEAARAEDSGNAWRVCIGDPTHRPDNGPNLRNTASADVPSRTACSRTLHHRAGLGGNGYGVVPVALESLLQPFEDVLTL